MDLEKIELLANRMSSELERAMWDNSGDYPATSCTGDGPVHDPEITIESLEKTMEYFESMRPKIYYIARDEVPVVNENGDHTIMDMSAFYQVGREHKVFLANPATVEALIEWARVEFPMFKLVELDPESPEAAPRLFEMPNPIPMAMPDRDEFCDPYRYCIETKWW